jgi:CRISPR-associated protein Cmr6
MSCRRDALNAVATAQGAHAGLLLDSYLRERTPEGRATHLGEAIEASARALPLYRLAYSRWEASLSIHRKRRFRTQGRVVVGMGEKGVLENGISLHHTYGLPLILGSGVKGLCSHYCATVWGGADANFLPTGEAHQILFGTNDDRGLLLFEDSWLVPSDQPVSPLKLDVMTPHYMDYYTGTGNQAPTGQQDPIPISFLSVEGEFLFAIGCAPSVGQEDQWLNLGLRILAEALAQWGIGSKTRAGYGRMVAA